ncbi:MAG TPA: NUDIX domain-containing protein [Patescibacteria group bacterium]|nr:NUDIX domain-containing protein [Patescibacteria group bacterium]
MSLEINIHAAQTSILRELLFLPAAGYAELQKPTGLTSDHFNFHISRLVELGLVEKTARGKYRLTTKGKEYANRLDTDNSTIERQPKVAVILAIERPGKNGETEFLFQERRKNPYFGFWGLPSGKIRWGETILETAQRESLEETGLDADFTVAGVYHEHAKHHQTGEFLEDKVFFVVNGKNARGDLLTDFEGGHNEWMTFKDASAKPKRFASFADEIEILYSKTWLVEQAVDVSEF